MDCFAIRSSVCGQVIGLKDRLVLLGRAKAQAQQAQMVFLI